MKSLVSSYKELCKCTDVNTELLIELNDIIPDGKKSEIQSTFDSRAKARILYDYLKDYGLDEHIPLLKAAMKESTNLKALKILNETSTDAVDSSNVPTQAEASVLNQKFESSSTTRQKLDEILEPYKNEGVMKALIINVSHDRPGAEHDSSELVTTLKGCNFEVEHCKDLSSQGIRNCIRNFKKDLEEYGKPGREGVGACLVAVMSHGTGYDWFSTEDGGQLSIKQHITDQFNNRNLFNAAEGKRIPKIFLVNICRGEKEDKGRLEETDLAPAKKPTAFDVESDFSLPSFTDMLICYSSYDEHVSYRGKGKGTWFIQTFCEVVQERADGNTDICDILNVVFHKISQKETPDKYKQSSPYYNIGFLKFYLKWNEWNPSSQT